RPQLPHARHRLVKGDPVKADSAQVHGGATAVAPFHNPLYPFAFRYLTLANGVKGPADTSDPPALEDSLGVKGPPATGYPPALEDSLRQVAPVSSGVRYHYLDEGAGDPVVMLHGNPTWSFYYRDLVRGLRDNYRTVVPDHVGCGLSDKPDDARYDYT